MKLLAAIHRSPPQHRARVSWLRRHSSPECLLAAATFAFVASAFAQPAVTGSVSGRVLNEATGQYLRNAVVAVAGTNLSTLAEAGGVYTLIGVPIGEARITASFADLDPAEATVTILPGRTAKKDFGLTSASYNRDTLKMGRFIVAAEREGNAKAIQDQRESLDAKTVIATDAFGDVPDGNVAEFLKFMPGISLDYIEAEARSVSIGGLDPQYTAVLMDGSPLASAASSSIDVGRKFEFEQLSISSIETIELSKTPTPDVAGSAMAGVINLRSKGAFDRKGRQIRYQSSVGFDSNNLTLGKSAGPDDTKNYKLQPNLSLEYSEVFKEKLGVIAGYKFSRTHAEQKWFSQNYAFNGNPADNATEVPRLNALQLFDSPKLVTRVNYNARLDYKVNDDFTTWLRIDYNRFKLVGMARGVSISMANAINAGGNSPVEPGVEYSLYRQTTTNATMQLNNTGGAVNKHGATTTAATGFTFKRGAFRADVQGQVSVSTNWQDDLPYGFFRIISSAPSLTNVRLSWTRPSPSQSGIIVTQESGPDWTDPANYPRGNASGVNNRHSSSDVKLTVRADFKYSINQRGMPVILKWGGDIKEDIRRIQRSGDLRYNYLGPDLIANSGDDYTGLFVEPLYRMKNPFGGNIKNLATWDRFALAREHKEHPDRFTEPTEAAILQGRLQNRYYTKEQIDSIYFQPIIKVTHRFDLAPGVRWENTRGSARGPNDIGDRQARIILTGNPTGAVDINSPDYIRMRYGSSNRTGTTDYDSLLRYVHLTYRYARPLVLRASYNESITRPPLNNLAGGIAINDTVTPPTVRMPNPDLENESARSLFASAEYYMPDRVGGGLLTVAATRRDLKDLIRSHTEDVPLDATGELEEFAGYRLTTSDNVGKAHLSSIELNYRQNLRFLPGAFRGLTVFGNYTKIRFDDYENFRRPTNLANGGLSFGYRAFSMNWKVNWVPAYRSSAIAANGWDLMNDVRLNHDVQATYRLQRNVTLSLTGRNVFNHNPRTYQHGAGAPYIVRRRSEYGSLWTAGIRGTF